MPVRIEMNAEPIPGYKLMERLGGGGFGEVWKAAAPGGLHKAIKFVYGDLEALDSPDGSRAEQELKALSRIKSVHHPYILSLERFDIIEGQLIIVMELADRTVWDRFKECRGQGLPGIPRDELLNYMRETAEALDLMNSLYQLQHLDIKPQNLFLVFNHIKVADFGLVKDLGGRSEATITGGSTPVYAAPETFDGWLSRHSDQYSLAIVYQELLTGQRPFNGNTIRQLVMQHLQGDPDLKALPPDDRAPIAKALAKKPENRFPTCLDMVNALRALRSAAPLEGGEARFARPGRGDEEVLADCPSSLSLELEKTQVARGKSASVAKANAEGLGKPEAEGRLLAHSSASAISGPPSAALESRTSAFKSRRVAANAADDGVLQPALILGVGQLGLQTLRHLRQWLRHEFGPLDEFPGIRLLGIDTDADAIAAAGQGDEGNTLRNNELIHTRLQRAGHYLKAREGRLPHERWLNSKLLYRLGRDAGAGTRALGRLALVEHARAIERRLEMEVASCVNPEAASTTSAFANLGRRRAGPRVYLAASLAGNTGSGMFLDLAYLARSVLRRMGYADADIVGCFYVPESGKNAGAALDLANTHAALMELRHFATPQARFTAAFDVENHPNARAFVEQGSAFQRCLFFPVLQKKSGAADGRAPEAVCLAGQFLFRELATNVGKKAEEDRLALTREARGAPLVGGFGLFRYYWPRRNLLEKTARRLARRLVDRWMAKSVKGLAEAIAPWIEQQWETEGMKLDDLIAKHQEECGKRLQENPESLIAAPLAPLTEALSHGPKPGQPLDLGPVVQAQSALVKLLGLPEDCQQRTEPNAYYEPGVLEQSLADAAAALAEKCEHQLAVWVVGLIENPSYRLAGAEEALRQFNARVEATLKSQEPLTKELQERAGALYRRIQSFVDSPPAASISSSGGWKMSFARKTRPSTPPPHLEILELVKTYAKCRYQSLILGHINRLFIGLRGQLSDQVREVGFCRQRLGELADLLSRTADADSKSTSVSLPTREQFLLPEGCRDLDQAVRQLEDKITDQDMLELDQLMQEVVCHHFQALLQVCMGSGTTVRNLAPLMLEEITLFLEPRLAGASVSDAFWRHKTRPINPTDSAGQELASANDRAASDLIADPDSEIALAVLPEDAQGNRLKTVLLSILPTIKTIATPRPDEILIWREQFLGSLDELDHLDGPARAAYQQRLSADPGSLHTREDIPEWAGTGKPQLALVH